MSEYSCYYKTTDHRKFNTWCKYTTHLDTYGCGCSHDCKYCYAKALLLFRGLWNPGKPKMSYISEIIKKLGALDKTEVIRLGSMTDCFQPLERIKKITYETIKILNQYRINYLIITKNSLVSSDEYVNIYDPTLAHFQISISNTDNKLCSEYENASPISERISSIEKLSDMGFDVSVRLSPAIESFIDFKAINKIKCKKILVEFLKVNGWIRKFFNIDYSNYTCKYGGHDNLQLENKIKFVDKIQNFDQVTVGEYVKEHHEYFRDNVNYNKEDCCNLSIRNIVSIAKQTELFSMAA